MGTIQIDGSTPKLTIGNATAEDALILFDGNAQDFHIGLDDSSDDLVIGVGSALGTTTALAIDENAGSTFSGAITVGVDDAGHDVKFFGNTASAYMLWDTSVDDLVLAGAAGIDLAGNIDVDGTANLDVVDIDGAVQIDGTVTVGVDDTGLDVKFFGATASSYMLWDESADDLNLIASGLGVGTAKDLGVGVHIRTADTSADVHNDADELVIENSATGGITILSGTSTEGRINFGDSGDNDIGRINYSHASDYMTFYTNTAIGLKIDSIGAVTKPLQPCFMVNTNGTISNVTGNDTEYSVVMGTERFDNNADFSTPNFTAPVSGRYFLSVSLGISGGSGDITYSNVYITTSNKRYDWFGGAGGNNGEGGSFKGAFSVVADMDASDTALVKVSAGGMGGDTLDIVDGSFFSGCLLS